jgi:hypothetical protein
VWQLLSSRETMIVQCESNQQSAAPTSPPRRAQRIVRRIIIASLSGPRAPVRTGAFGASWVCRFAWRPAGLGAMRLRSCWLRAPAVKRPLAARPRCTRVPSMTARTSLPLRLPRSCASTRGSTHSRHCARSSVSATATRPVRHCRPQRAGEWKSAGRAECVHGSAGSAGRTYTALPR